MKRKDISRKIRNRIDSGWREYLTIKIDKDLLGLKGVETPTYKNLCKVFELQPCKYSTGVVDSYYFIDEKQAKVCENGEKLDRIVGIKLVSEYYSDEVSLQASIERIKEWHGDNITYVIQDCYVYYLTSIEAYINPKYDEYKTNEECIYHDGYEIEHKYYYGEDAEEALKLFMVGKDIEESMYDSHFICNLIRGRYQKNTSGLLSELGYLCNLCKATYFDFKGNDVIITYGIRYKSNIKPFTTLYKKIATKYNHKFLR